MEEIEHTMPIEQLLERLGVSKVTTGISDPILMRRLSEDGYNQISKEKLKATGITMFLDNLMFFLYCCIFTSILVALSERGPSSSLSHMFLMGFTFVAHMISIFTTEKQEIPEITSTIAVIRNGKSNLLDSKYLVRGDIVELEHSMISPADIRLIKANNLMVNGSFLLGKEGIRMGNAVGTGEYLYSSNMVFQGFTIETGKGIGIVLQTGPRTVLSKNLNRPTILTAFEVKWILFVACLWACGLAWQKFVRKENFYHAFLLLCLVLTKFPHFIMKGRSLSLLTTTHLMIANQVYPKTIFLHPMLSKIKYFIYDIRDLLVNDTKEVKKVYVCDQMSEVSKLEMSEDYKHLLNVTYFATYKEKKVEAPKEPVSLEEYDPTPPEPEYIHPIEAVLRDHLAIYGLPETDHTIHLKIPLSSKNRNSLTVITPVNQVPLAILVGEATEVLKSSKLMRVSGQNKELPIRTLTSMCDEFTLEGHLCVAVAFSEIDPKLIENKSELTPEIFEFSLCGIYVIKEYTEDATVAFQLAKELGISLIGVGRDSKEYLLNLAYLANLITEPPSEYNGQEVKPWLNLCVSASNAMKNPGLLKDSFTFIPGMTLFDVANLINLLKPDNVGYIGQNHVALKVSDVGISMKNNSKEVKESSNFVLLSNTPLVDFLKCIKTLRNFGTYDFFFMKELLGCLIPSISYFIVVVMIQGKTSSLGILLVDFAVPLSSQFLWIGFPKNGYDSPVGAWIICTLSGFLNYFYCHSKGITLQGCNYAYFMTVLVCGLLKIVYLQICNRKKQKVAWIFVYFFVGLKCLLFYLFCLIDFVAIQNDLESIDSEWLLQGIIFYISTMFIFKVISKK